MHLVIAEKGSAALRLAVVLSGGTFRRRRLGGIMAFEFEREGAPYAVVGLRGHIVEIDYPPELHEWTSEGLEAVLAAQVVERVSEPAIADALRALAASADDAVIATDYDREGELIGMEALRIAREAKPGLPAKRARFSALTKVEIEETFRNLVDVDERLAASARAREEIDLAWGAVLTRFLSLACGMHGRHFLSAGRVQTPTLALVVDREREIEEFVPEPYWTVTATIGTEPPVQAIHAAERFWRRDAADATQGRAELAEDALVVGCESKEVEGRRPPPFNTTGFLAEATRLGMGAGKAMQVAEDLYRRGYLSYPRTDNTVYPPTLSMRSVLERLLDSDFAAEASELLAQESIHASRGPVEARDHPPVYPTASARKETLKEDLWKVYELVVRRFLATVAPVARERDTRAEFDVGGEPFFARGRELLDPGWRRYAGIPFTPSAVPPLRVGERVPVVAVTEESGETEPPGRYDQGRLIQEMDRQGLGTKSTRHEIVQKLYERGYVGGRRLQATAAGRAVVEALEAYGGQVARPEMTASLEHAMDAIADGVLRSEDVVAESRALLTTALAEMRGHEPGIARWVRTAIADEIEVGTCEKCGGTMLLRRTRTGRRFVGCSNFPTCRNTRNVPGPGFVVPTDESCTRCGARKLARVRQGVADLLCVAPTCSDEDLTRILGT